MISHQEILRCVMEFNTIKYVGMHTKIEEILLGEGSGKTLLKNPQDSQSLPDSVFLSVNQKY